MAGLRWMTHAFAGALTPRTGRAYDAVGVTERNGPRVMDLLPRAGCVLADAGRWWWIVPPQSDVGVSWPPLTHYAVGGRMAGPSEGRTGLAGEEPRLVHWPRDNEPYTHPLLLHIAVCAAAGISPAWPREDRRPPS